MEYIHINGQKIPLVGLGTFPLRGDSLMASVHSAVELGYELFDTAWKYKNERDLALALKDCGIRRKDVILTSKVCADQVVGNKYLLHLNKNTANKSLKESLTQLCTDYIDAYLIHGPFLNYWKTYKEIIELKEKGTVRIAGVCNFNIDQLKTLKEKCGEYPQINQIELHPFRQQEDVVCFCKDQGIVVEAHSPFAHGDAFSELFKNDLLLSIAQETGKTILQVILRWLIQRKIVAIPCSKNHNHQKENLDIFDFDLTEKQLSLIQRIDRNISYGYVSSMIKQ